MEDRRAGPEEGRNLPVLALSERLEESALHRQLARQDGLRVIVDRAGEVRTLRPVPSAPREREPLPADRRR